MKVKWEIKKYPDGFYVACLSKYIFFGLIPIFYTCGSGSSEDKAKKDALRKAVERGLVENYTMVEYI